MYRAAVCDSTLGNDLISFHSYLFWCLSQKSEVPADYDKHDPEQKQIYRFVRTLFSAAQLTAECAIVTLVSKQFSRETQSLHTFSPFLFALTQIGWTHDSLRLVFHYKHLMWVGSLQQRDRTSRDIIWMWHKRHNKGGCRGDVTPAARSDSGTVVLFLCSHFPCCQVSRMAVLIL